MLKLPVVVPGMDHQLFFVSSTDGSSQQGARQNDGCSPSNQMSCFHYF
jgi:hypothetical protein